MFMKKRQKGFSLIELMATIGLIGVIAGVGFPAIDNFGDQENYETDVATIRGQINYVRQLSLEEGTAYTIWIVNDTSNNTADLEVWQAQGRKRFNVEYHKEDVDENDPKCSRFNDQVDEDGDSLTENAEVDYNKGTKINTLTKKLEHITISRCSSITGNCTKENADANFFCFLPDGSAPEGMRAEIQASENAGGKKDYLHTYESGFFNIGKRM